MTNPYADPPYEPSIVGVVRIEGDAVVCHKDIDLRKYCIFTGEPLWSEVGGLPLGILFPLAVYFSGYARWLPVLRVVVAIVFIVLATMFEFGIAAGFVTMVSVLHWAQAVLAGRILRQTKASWAHPPIWLRRVCLATMFPAIILVSALGIAWFRYGISFPEPVLSPWGLMVVGFVIGAIVAEWQLPKIFVALLPGDLLRIEGFSEAVLLQLRKEVEDQNVFVAKVALEDTSIDE